MQSRLTNTDYLTDVLHLKNHKTQWGYNNDLWQYAKEREDIEEELDIDLMTLFKALKNGIYCKGVNVYGDYDKTFVKINHKQCEFDIKNKVLYEISDINFQPIFPVKLADYGKTWALTKEELL